MNRRLFLSALAVPLAAHPLARLDGKTLRTPMNLVFEGDSLTSGSGIPVADNYPSQLSGELYGLDVRVTSFASELATLRDVIYPRQATIDAAYVNGRINVLCIWGGTNDFKMLGLTAKDVYSVLYAPYIRDRMARGWIVIPFTVLPRWNPQTSASFEPERQAFNAMVRANNLPLLADVAADPRLQSWADTRYFFDGTHLTKAACGIVKDIVHLQLQAA